MGLTRRRMLVTAGTGVLGFSVVTTIGGCTSSKKEEPAPPAGTTPPATPGSSDGSEALPGNWRRVDLSFVSAYILVRGSEVAVVDLGTPGSEVAIGAGLEAAGVGWAAVRHVILTHKHQDHAGSTPEVAPKVTNGTIYSGAADLAGIDSPTPLKPLGDNDEVFGLRIIHTPGHTAGHIAVFDPATGVLAAGDALRTTQGLEGSDPRYTYDEAQAKASVRKLAALDVKVILPGHGDPLTTGAAEALKKLAG
jgi:glyoxylase-like metal-dependent hydrolase (beta-lactamase superfamily II)